MLLSANHLGMGFGAGHAEVEFRAAGLPYPPAAKRVDHLVEAVGDRVLDLAAGHADIVGLVGFTSGTGQRHSNLSHFSWRGLADRIGRVRRSARRRVEEIELSVVVEAVVVTDGRQGTV